MILRCLQVSRSLVQVLNDALLILQETNDLVCGIANLLSYVARSRGVDMWRINRLARYRWG
jgi:hypothetical protein